MTRDTLSIPEPKISKYAYDFVDRNGKLRQVMFEAESVKIAAQILEDFAESLPRLDGSNA